MAKIRAYKLAEEFGLEREEFLEKAAAFGIVLRSAMVGVDDDDEAALRAKFGKRTGEETVEKRVGSGVIRRRRKKIAPVAEPPSVAQPPADAGQEPSAAPPAAEAAAAPDTTGVEPEPLAADAEADSAIAPRMSRPAVVVEDPLVVHEAARLAAREAAAGTTEPDEVRATPTAQTADREHGRRAAPTPEPASAAAKRVRRVAREGQNLKEQDTLARQARGNVQAHLERRRMIVDQQSRQNSGRRGAPQPKRKLALSTAPPKQKVVRLGATISLADLSNQTGQKVRDLLRRARALDAEVERDAALDAETATLLAEDVGYTVQRLESDAEKAAAAVEAGRETSPEEGAPRPPVVTVMGHVDHGKTSLLDTIRHANVVESEAGGITQHIGAYQVQQGDDAITFIDTPGHAAFTQMRARGAKVTDLVVLVVAANDGVMPQTVEAINHARAAGVPILVAINKIDLPEADPQRTKQALLEHELVAEEFGGDTICVEVSATKGTNIDKLLEMLALQAEVLELRARPTGLARGVVIEAQLDRQRGPIATVLVQEGELARGDSVVVGSVWGRMRTIEDDQGNAVERVGPSSPVRLVGLSSVPEAGDELVAVKNEREARKIIAHRIDEAKRAEAAPGAPEMPSAEDIFASLEESDEKELLVLIKADVRGTLEAIRESLENLSTDRVKLRVLHSGIGGISESDVMLASASNAVVIGFHVRPEPVASRLAEKDGTQIRTFDIVYELLDDAAQLMQGLLPMKQIEQIIGRAEVRELFHSPRVGNVAGCAVVDGMISRSVRARVLRDSVPVYTGVLGSLRHFKDDVREVRSPNECGMSLENFSDVKVGDVIESFEIEEVPDTI